MFKRLLISASIFIVIALGALGWYVFRTPEAASTPIQAIPLAQATTATSATSATMGASSVATTNESATLFEIVPAESKAIFLIDEVLRGSPVTVEGTTDQVAGQLSIDPTNLSTAEIGTIQINARTLATDNDFRNRAIKNVILETDANEFITFKPTQITGLSSTGVVGQASTFQITGDLTIKGVTKPVTFEATATPSSASRIEGTATTTVNYADFELAIPDSPSVDTVADQVRLQLQFVAQAAA